MNELAIQYNEKVLAAWYSICDWCKTHLANVIPGGVVAQFPFDSFGWINLAVTEQGNVQLHVGSYGDSSQTVYTRDYVMKFASGHMAGKNCSYSRVHSYDTKINEDNSDLYQRCMQSFPLKADSTKICLDKIEEAVNLWGHLKHQLLFRLEQVRKMDNFIA